MAEGHLRVRRGDGQVASVVPLRRPCRLGARRPVPGVLQHQGTGLSPWDAELLAASSEPEMRVVYQKLLEKTAALGGD